MNCRTSRWCSSLIVLIYAGGVFTPAILACIFSCIFSCIFPSSAYADGPAITRVLKQNPDLNGFDFCHGGGCAKVVRASLTAEEWWQVEDVFDPRPETADEERDCIARAIGLMESIVGTKTGTDADRAGTFGNSDIPGQLDCNDESTNSTTYMKLMQHAGLIRFHEIEDTKTRNFFFNGWPHTTAVIREKSADPSLEKTYAVDSWFYDNGKPAAIIPLGEWKSGWKPANTAAH